MNNKRYVGMRKVLASLCLPLLLAAPALDALAQLWPATPPSTVRRLPAEPGTNAFASMNYNEEGHSLVNAYLLAMVSHYMYPHAYEPNTGDQFEVFAYQAERVFRRWGMDRVDLETHGNVQYVVMSDEHVVIVAFRGSDAVSHMDAWDDWVNTDFNADQTKVSTWGTVPFSSRTWWGGTETVRKAPGVHKGFRSAYWSVRNRINKLIHDHRDGKSKKLFITGHSLGAGLAILAAIDQGFATDRPSSRRYVAQGVYTYGGPRVGNGIFKRLYDSKRSTGNAPALNTQRYVNYNDIFAMIPGDSLVDDVNYVDVSLYGLGEPHDNVKYTHVGRTHNIRQNGTIDRDSAEYRGIGTHLPHHSSHYAYHIFYAYIAGKSLEDRMPPPPERNSRVEL
jgi:hypothetical protein